MRRYLTILGLLVLGALLGSYDQSPQLTTEQTLFPQHISEQISEDDFSSLININTTRQSSHTPSVRRLCSHNRSYKAYIQSTAVAPVLLHISGYSLLYSYCCEYTSAISLVFKWCNIRI